VAVCSRASKAAATNVDGRERCVRRTTAVDGIPPERTIVHCGSGVTACHTLLAMERAGMRGAKLYVGSWSEWCRQPERVRDPA
jgi:3-mercaptopyruvate sulfurtransferase SseA